MARRPNPYVRRPARRRVALVEAQGAGMGGGAGPGVRILGIEVCQSIQDMTNAVTLVARKATVVRVYVDHATLAAKGTLTGEVEWRRAATAPGTYLPTASVIKVDPANAVALADQRDDVAKSLNFRLPPEALEVGELWLRLGRLSVVGHGDLMLQQSADVHVRFQSGPALRVKVIGLRYRDDVTGKTHTPDAVHFAYMRSYLRRAYPVPDVVWSQIVVDANFRPPFGANTPRLSNLQVAAIRATEINAGGDRGTHYYGLVDDGQRQHFMRGLASGIPAQPQPDTVASGPCGAGNGFAGDNDLSYADWYGAHELGHTFGRYHPGFPPGQQDASDPQFPFANGQLSNADRRYVGFDVGDESLGIPMAALSGTAHHDVMTYAPRQWLSAHTYEAIFARVVAEFQLFPF